MMRDGCSPNLAWDVNQATKMITGVTVTTVGNTCRAPIPVTFPGSVTSSQLFPTEQIGSGIYSCAFLETLANH